VNTYNDEHAQQQTHTTANMHNDGHANNEHTNTTPDADATKSNN
jgi:hypothetical protein